MCTTLNEGNTLESTLMFDDFMFQVYFNGPIYQSIRVLHRTLLLHRVGEKVSNNDMELRHYILIMKV